jgi:hypothetical protein
VLGASARQSAHVLQAACQRVAAALELRQTEQARAGERLVLGAARRVDCDVRKERRDRPRQLALGVRDLRAQRAARRPLVALLDGLSALLDRQLLELAHASDSSSVTPNAPILPVPGGLECAATAP